MHKTVADISGFARKLLGRDACKAFFVEKDFERRKRGHNDVDAKVPLIPVEEQRVCNVALDHGGLFCGSAHGGREQCAEGGAERGE